MAEPTDRQRIETLEKELAELRTENTRLREAETKPKKPFAWRKFWSRLFIALGLVLIIPAALLIWLNRTITNTDQYVATVGPIISEPAVQKAVTQAATTQIFQNIDIQQEVTNLLPDQAKILAGPISSQVEGFITTNVSKIVASQQFATLWVNVNREAQINFMRVAESSGSPVVDVNRLYGFVSGQLSNTPLAPLAGKQLPPKIGQIQVANVPALERIPHAVAMLDQWRWILFGSAVLAMALALWIGTDRRRVAIQIGLVWILATIITFIIVRITRGVVLAQITDPVYKDAALAVWQTLFKPFAIQSFVLFLGGAVVALTGWMLGPSRPAVAVRSHSNLWLGSARMSLFPALETTGFVRWLRQRHYAILWGLLALGIVILLLNIPLAPVELAWIVIGELIALIVIEFFVAPAPAKYIQTQLPV